MWKPLRLSPLTVPLQDPHAASRRQSDPSLLQGSPHGHPVQLSTEPEEVALWNACRRLSEGLKQIAFLREAFGYKIAPPHSASPV